MQCFSFSFHALSSNVFLISLFVISLVFVNSNNLATHIISHVFFPQPDVSLYSQPVRGSIMPQSTRADIKYKEQTWVEGEEESAEARLIVSITGTLPLQGLCLVIWITWETPWTNAQHKKLLLYLCPATAWWASWLAIVPFPIRTRVRDAAKFSVGLTHKELPLNTFNKLTFFDFRPWLFSKHISDVKSMLAYLTNHTKGQSLEINFRRLERMTFIARNKPLMYCTIKY